MSKKWLLAAVAGVSLLTLAACGGTKKNSTSSSDSKNTLSIWATDPTPSSTVSSWRKNPFHTELAKRTGVKVDWQFPTDKADTDNAFNLMISDTDLPDMIMYGQMNKKAQELMDDGTIRDLTKLLPKKAPHYWKYLQDHPDIAKAMKTQDGQYYGVGFFREKPKQEVWAGPLIRQDWLNAQNLKTPSNIAELENVLKVFKEKYNARLGIYPHYMMTPGFAGAFGAYGTFLPTYYLDNNKVKLAQTQPEWKTYITWLHKLYKEGLIDPDFVTMDTPDMRKQAGKNKVGVVFGTSGDITDYLNDSKTSGNKAEWVAFSYPKQADGSAPVSIFNEGGQARGTATVITKSCPDDKVNTALKWLDYAFTEEGHMYWNYGVKGDTYTMKDGKPVFTDKITKNKLGIAEAVRLYTGAYEDGIGIQDDSLDQQVKNNASAANATALWWEPNQSALKATLPSAMTFTSAEAKESASLDDTMNTYVQENALKFVTGEKPLSDYSAFEKEIKKLGLKRSIELRQAAYDRYEKR